MPAVSPTFATSTATSRASAGLMDLGLAGARVVVTAAAAGIGRATAILFAEAGAWVQVCDIDAEGLVELCRHDRIDGAIADVASTSSIDDFMVRALDALGGIDVLVNNAGIAGPGGRLETIDVDDVVRTLDVNVASMFRTSRHAIPPMIAARSGSIVNIASTAGLHGFPYRSAYAASKWAVIGLTKTMAMELGEHGVRVNAICPGSISGTRMDHVVELESRASGRSAAEIRLGFERQVSMRTFVDAHEIAQTVAFLASSLGRKVSGQALSVDGHTESLRTW